MPELTDEEMETFLSCLPFPFSRGQRPLAPNDDLAADDGEFEHVQKRFRSNNYTGFDDEIDPQLCYAIDEDGGLQTSASDFFSFDEPMLPWAMEQGVVQESPSWVEQELQGRLEAFRTTCLPHVAPLDFTQQIRFAVEAYFPQGVPPPREHPLSAKLDKMLAMTAAVIALIRFLGNTRRALFIHQHPNRSTAGKTRDQIEATVRTKKVFGVAMVVRHFNVKKRSLGRSLKWALGCRSSGSGKKEKFLRHNQHISYDQAKKKLLYFGDQAY